MFINKLCSIQLLFQLRDRWAVLYSFYSGLLIILEISRRLKRKDENSNQMASILVIMLMGLKRAERPRRTLWRILGNVVCVAGVNAAKIARNIMFINGNNRNPISTSRRSPFGLRSGTQHQAISAKT